MGSSFCLAGFPLEQHLFLWNWKMHVTPLALAGSEQSNSHRKRCQGQFDLEAKQGKEGFMMIQE